MAQTRRAQILMEPEEYRQLEEIASRKGVSVAELFRSAVRERYLRVVPEDRRRIVETMFALELAVPEWDELRTELDSVHGGGDR